MTREEIEELKGLAASMGLYDDKNPCKRAVILGKAIKTLEQEPCDDEYIKVPKKALRYRTAGMVAYNVEWLKNHFDIERAVICGEQQFCEDAISRQAAINVLEKILPANPLKSEFTKGITRGAALAIEYVKQLPSTQPEVIRCKECKHRASYWGNCKLLEEKYRQSVIVDGDSFCSLAERREE